MKILAIDGNSIINRAFYGIRLLTTKSGEYTNAVYGFITTLNRILADENPDGVVVAFDVKKPTFRHEKYAEYKAGRKGMPEELHSQMPILKEWLSLMGYCIIEKAGYEADDILGTVAAMCEEKGSECVIATGDRDALQLVTDTTRVLLTATKMGRPEHTNYNKAALFERYGVSPQGMLELKALQGDSSDNIPGVAGIGEKTAADLITRFGSIDYIYENIDTLDIKETVKNKLIAGKDNAYLSRWLGEICKKVPLGMELSEFLPRERDEHGVAALMTRLEFFKLMENMGITPEAPQLSMSFDEKKSKFSVVKPSEFSAEKSVCILPLADFTRMVMVSGEKIADFDTAADLEGLTEILSSGSEKRVYDYKNLYKWAVKNNISINNVVFDSLLAAYLENPSSSSYEISRLCAEYSGGDAEMEGDSYEALELGAKHSAVCDTLYALLEEKEQLKLLCDIEIPLAEVLGDMELYGFLLDSEGLKTYGDELEQRINLLQSEIYELVGYEFNLNSPKQLGVALFEKLGLPAKKKTKSGYSTSAEVLEELRDIHPSIDKLLTYRSLSKLKSTYCDGLLDKVSADGRVRSTFNQTETRTGRISSLEPNLQNIPVRTEEGRRLRKFFKAPDGYVLCDADYSQIELRVLAHIAEDENMIKAFSEGTDIHTATAAVAFGLPIEMVTPQLRSRAKAVNFGIVYGIGAFSLAKDIGVTRKEADNLIKSYLAAYSGVDAYMNSVIERAKANGYIVTLFGRRRYLPELASSNGMLRAFGERVARNAPIQGTAADIIKIAMIRVWSRLKAEKLDARLILQVHDELIVECKEELKDTVCAIITEEMSKAAELKVSLVADAAYGKNWFEAKK